MTYDRLAALEYARQHWLCVASDGYIAGEFSTAKPYRQVPAGTEFVHDDDPSAPEHALLEDGTVIPWSSLDDCTHFISCCVGRPPGDAPAGGLFLPSDFPSGPYGILGASRFVQTLIKKGLVEVIPVADKTAPRPRPHRPGDLIGYYRHSKGQYAHVVMYAGDESIICHSYSRSDAEECTWDHRYSLGVDNDDWEWRLLRFTSPAPG